MQAVWKGSVQFALVTMPVRAYAATEDRTVRFKELHRADAGRIRHRRVCSACGREVPFADLARGYELGGGDLVVLDDADFEHLPLPSARTLEVTEFVPVEEVDPLLFDRGYYLLPEPVAARAYDVLLQAMRATEHVAVGKIALRQRETPAVLRARPDVLVLHRLRWPDELRTPPTGERPRHTPVRDRELDMATTLIESMAGHWRPAEWHDDTRRAVEEIIEAKAAGALPPAPAAPEPTAVDLMQALAASLEHHRGSTPGS